MKIFDCSAARFARHASAVVGIAASLVAGGRASAAVIITSTVDNITLGATALGGNNTAPDPAVLPAGTVSTSSLAYTASASTPDFSNAAYRLPNLNDNDGQSLAASDGTYTILTTVSNAVTLTLTFTGGAQTVTGIAISNGYLLRDNGTYTITDAADNAQGTYTIATTGSDAHNNADVFYLSFDTPVTTTALKFNITSTDSSGGLATASFREIEVFPVPEPATLGLAGLATCGLLSRRRAKADR